MRGIRRSPANSPHKGQWLGANSIVQYHQNHYICHYWYQYNYHHYLKVDKELNIWCWHSHFLTLYVYTFKILIFCQQTRSNLQVSINDIFNMFSCRICAPITEITESRKYKDQFIHFLSMPLIFNTNRTSLIFIVDLADTFLWLVINLCVRVFIIMNYISLDCRRG